LKSVLKKAARSSWNSLRVNQSAHQSGLLLRVEAGVGQELSARGNGVLGQQILPAGAVDGQFYGHNIAHVHRALERNQVVGDGVGGLGLVLLEHVVVAGDIERELALLVELRPPSTTRSPPTSR
jgi:hypothetical protein